MSNKITLKPPPAYHFSGWDVWYRTALRYHEALHPNNCIVGDRSQTFSDHMSIGVNKYLGGLVRPHPRYCTAEGWDDWVIQVTRMLELRDESAKNLANLHYLLLRYKDREISESWLWDGLDRLVVYGDISSSEQRELFWSALTRKAKVRLTRQCSYVDPGSDAWTLSKSNSAQIAAQQVSLFMEYLKLRDTVADDNRRFFLFALPEMCLLALSIGGLRSGSVGYITLGVIGLLISLSFGTSLVVRRCQSISLRTAVYNVRSRTGMREWLVANLELL